MYFWRNSFAGTDRFSGISGWTLNIPTLNIAAWGSPSCRNTEIIEYHVSQFDGYYW